MRTPRRLIVGFALAAVLALPGSVAADPSLTGRAEPPAPFMHLEPVRPYQPGDLVWLIEPPTIELSPLSLLSSGCQRVPSSGYIGTGVYASSSSVYSNYWSWGAASSGQPFYWYVKRNDDSDAASGYSGGGGGSSSIGANVYHWKVQNQGSTPQAWDVCWDVL